MLHELSILCFGIMKILPQRSSDAQLRLYCDTSFGSCEIAVQMLHIDAVNAVKFESDLVSWQIS